MFIFKWKNNIFGGYSSIPWQNNGGDKTSNDCFLFTLTNIYLNLPNFHMLKEEVFIMILIMDFILVEI